MEASNSKKTGRPHKRTPVFCITDLKNLHSFLRNANQSLEYDSSNLAKDAAFF